MIAEQPAIGAEYAGYRAVLAAEALLPPREWTFKSNIAYRQILEHVTPEQGHAYYAEIAEEWPEILEKFRDIIVRIVLDNDRIGRPVVHEFAELGISCSPTNLRYLHQALMVWAHIKSSQMHTVDFIEIGGGYGGLALYISRLAPIFRSVLRSYTIVDVPEASAIQTAFAHEQSFTLVATTDILGIRARTIPKDRFLISAYGFSEFSQEVRGYYVDNLIRDIPHGLLVWNAVPVYQFVDVPLTAIAEERPLTGYGNKVVRF